MDSKRVSARLRDEVRPVLYAAGFRNFTQRSAWRYHETGVDVVNFQSFQQAQARWMSCTPHSLAVNLGHQPFYLPPLDRPARPTLLRQKSWLPQPKEHACPFRASMSRSFEQKELGSRQIWYVGRHGEGLDAVLADLRGVIQSTVLPWFDRLDVPREVLRTLLLDEEGWESGFGFGRKFGPVRAYYTGYAARYLGEWHLAARKLQEALASGQFELVDRRLREDLRACRERLRAARPAQAPAARNGQLVLPG